MLSSALAATFAMCCSPSQAVRSASGARCVGAGFGRPPRRLVLALAAAGCPLGAVPLLPHAAAAGAPLLCEEDARAWRMPSTPGSSGIDTQGWMGETRRLRLERILAKLEGDTGFRVRVATLSRGCPSRAQLFDYWQLGRGRDATSTFNLLLVLADRGLSGRMEAGGSLLRFEAGAEVRAPKSHPSATRERHPREPLRVHEQSYA